METVACKEFNLLHTDAFEVIASGIQIELKNPGAKPLDELQLQYELAIAETNNA
jgi:hypothetical protein